MDKWPNLIVAEHQLALGLFWNTRKLTVSIPGEYLDKTLHVLRTVWPKDRSGKRQKACLCLGSCNACRKVQSTHGGSSLHSILEPLFLYIGWVCTSTEQVDTPGLLNTFPRSWYEHTMQELRPKLKLNKDHGNIFRFASKKGSKDGTSFTNWI